MKIILFTTFVASPISAESYRFRNDRLAEVFSQERVGQSGDELDHYCCSDVIASAALHLSPDFPAQ